MYQYLIRNGIVVRRRTPLAIAIDLFIEYDFGPAYDRLERRILRARTDEAAARLARVQDALVDYHQTLMESF